MTRPPADAPPEAAVARPRVGFLGVGWIGRDRLEAILRTGVVEVVGIADPSPENAAEAGRLVPQAELASTLDDLLDLEPDGVVIATPSALHAEQSVRALRRGAAVFCQKPLRRTGPDKPWFYDPALSGGGCVIDLGVHLVDLALWTLDFPDVSGVSANLFACGEPLGRMP